jgi:hypothetical protein
MNDPVEQLARWLHRTACRSRGRVWLARPPECLFSVPVVVEVNHAD